MKRKPSSERRKPEPPAPTVYQVPPLVLDEHQIREQLRADLKREPDDTDLRLRKLDLELRHFFARSEPDPDRNLRYLCALEYALSWADAAFAKQQPRPWDNDTYKGSLHAAINHALNLETLKR